MGKSFQTFIFTAVTAMHIFISAQTFRCHCGSGTISKFHVLIPSRATSHRATDPVGVSRRKPGDRQYSQGKRTKCLLPVGKTEVPNKSCCCCSPALPSAADAAVV